MSKCSCESPIPNRCAPEQPLFMNNPCTCTPVVYECPKCETKPITQLEKPCYTPPSYCSEGCEETLPTECVIVKDQISNLGKTSQEAFNQLDLKYQSLCILFNTMTPNSIVSYSYTSDCVLPTLTSVKKNGVEMLISPVTNNRNTVLLTLQSIDPNWILTTTAFEIKGTDIWEIKINC